MHRRVHALPVALASLALLLVGPSHGPRAQGTPPSRPTLSAATRSRGPRPPSHGTPVVDSDRIPVGTSPVDGPSDALVTLVLFGDARDFFTARAEPMLAAMHARYGDDVRVVWKTHPHAMLDPDGERTAEALMAAHAQGRFWPLLAWFEAHPGASTDAEYTAGARAAAIDLDRFRQDLATHAQHAAVEADTQLARSLGGPDITPIFYVNGTRVVGAHPLERFVPLIDAALAGARAVTPRERAYAEGVRNPPVDPEGTPVPLATESHVIDLAQRYRVSAERAPVWGRADAPVTVVAFEDFECPACAQVEPVLAALRQRFPDDLRIVWR
ncbi:MAG: thioredoxin domain-containing protein, partial [Deltaproteobacteria bacterium]